MKRLLLLIPLFVIIFLSCALFRARQQIKTQSETTTIQQSEEQTQETETASRGVLNRLFGKDQEAGTSGKEKKTEEKTSAKTPQTESASAAATTAAKRGMLSDDEMDIIKELGINLKNITEKRTSEVTMKLSDGLITETTSLKEVKPVTTKRNSSGSGSGGGSGSGSGSDSGSGSGDTAGTPAAPASKTDKEILSSGKYVMEATVKRGNGRPAAFKIYSENGKYAVFTDINVSEDDTVGVEILLEDGKFVFVIRSLKAYVNGGDANEYKFKKQVFDDIIKPVTSTDSGAQPLDIATVTLGGKDYTVEEYRTSDSQTVKYYCLGDKIERIEILNSDGTNFIIEISSLSQNVPSDAFAIPSGYTNMTKVAKSYLSDIKQKSIL